MQDKFTIEELVIKILPGGFFLAVIFFFQIIRKLI